MSDRTRWRITGTFTTTSPLHVGSGEVKVDERLKYKKDRNSDEETENCDVQAVVKDHRGKPCIPGTAIKGVLRAWAEEFYKGDAALERIFGKRNAGAADAKSGKAEFHTAVFQSLGSHKYPDTVPYWNAEAGTGVMSSVSIDRATGAAARNLLFFHEFVPEGTTFNVEITATGLTKGDVALLLAVLERGSAHLTHPYLTHPYLTHPYQFGASGADGWGRMEWQRTSVTTWDGKTPGVGFACCATSAVLPDPPEPKAALERISFDLTLKFHGPFLVNDASRNKKKLKENATEIEKRVNDALRSFTPLRRADGGVWLPASSFRGVLRSRAEFLANSRGWSKERWENLFGTTKRAARLTVAEFTESGRSNQRHQDFVAIDRFTGGAAEGAKFDATYADRPKLTTTLVLDPRGLDADDLSLLAESLNDVCEGAVTFGFGGSKGYGAATGTLCDAGQRWMKEHGVQRPTASPNPVDSVPSATLDHLEIEQDKNGKLKRYLRSNRAAGKTVTWSTLSKDLQDDTTVGTIEVEYDLVSDQPARIRRKGGTFIDPNPTSSAAATASKAKLSTTDFAHPYYFLRMADRKGFSGDLADAAPVEHDRIHSDRYSGTLRVKLTTKTPLLACDTSPGAAVEDPKGHFTYTMLRDADGRPLLPSSSVRGMLRSAYEAITNSRFGVFHGHTDRLGLRMATDEGLGLVPCRIAGGVIQLLPGTSRVSGARPGGPMYAAWLPRGTKFSSTSVEPVHRQAVSCWIELWQRTPWNQRENRFREDQRFDYWKVVAVAPHGQQLPEPPPSPARNRQPGQNHHMPLGQPLRFVADGFACITGYNFDRKHDERVFFADSVAKTVPLTPALAIAWANLIRDYRTNQDLVNGKPRPGALQRAGWSRHMSDDNELDLADGSLAYARLDSAGGVRELYPVSISRKLYTKAPRDLLPASLLPATSEVELSPADRVFGWVNQGTTPDGQQPARRSLIRVGPVTCKRDDAIQTHTPPIPLAILGQPKPAQGRFYLGNKDGFAQPHGGTKEDRGYQGDPAKKTGNRIRGPKVYPHHRAGVNPTHYKATGPKAKSNQNRSIAEWVKVGTDFTFDLHVTNLSAVELGALAWLLALPADQFLRIGLGKPLGFGSVRAEIVGSTVNAGKSIADLAMLKAQFEAEINKANPELLKAFGIAAAGFAGLSVQYPPAQDPNSNSGEEGGMHFQWFATNEGSGKNVGPRLSLPDLVGDPSLPISPGKAM